MEIAEMLEFHVGLAESESNRRCGSDRLVEVRVGRALDCLLKFRFYPIGIGKVFNDFVEVTSVLHIAGGGDQCK